MAECISRETAIEKLNRLCDRVCQYSKAQRKYMCGACPLGDAFTVIEDDIPAADVRPVVRGKWIPQTYEWRGRVLQTQDEWCGPIYECSVCGTEIIDRWKYCPACGAMMEAAEEEDE